VENDPYSPLDLAFSRAALSGGGQVFRAAKSQLYWLNLRLNTG
jgi:hypothetical protein